MTTPFIGIVRRMDRLASSPEASAATGTPGHDAYARSLAELVVKYFEEIPLIIGPKAQEAHKVVTRFMLEGLGRAGIWGALQDLYTNLDGEGKARPRATFYLRSVLEQVIAPETKIKPEDRLWAVMLLAGDLQGKGPLVNSVRTFLNAQLERALNENDLTSVRYVLIAEENYRKEKPQRAPLFDAYAYAPWIISYMKGALQKHDTTRLDEEYSIADYGEYVSIAEKAFEAQKASGSSPAQEIEGKFAAASANFGIVLARKTRESEESAIAALAATITARTAPPPAAPVAPADRQAQEGGATKGKGRRNGNGPKGPAPGES